ncbi:uncharacterized protein METZ01_LOCUS104676, partial [marine metagenome]
MSNDDCYTVGVFEDVRSAERVLGALAERKFPSEILSVVAADGPGVVELLQKTFGAGGDILDVRAVGTLRLHGPIV